MSQLSFMFLSHTYCKAVHFYMLGQFNKQVDLGSPGGLQRITYPFRSHASSQVSIYLLLPQPSTLYHLPLPPLSSLSSPSLVSWLLSFYLVHKCLLHRSQLYIIQVVIDFLNFNSSFILCLPSVAQLYQKTLFFLV